MPIQQVAFQRGGVAMTQGAAELGRAVEMETKDATNLLASGQTIGGQARVGCYLTKAKFTSAASMRAGPA